MRGMRTRAVSAACITAAAILGLAACTPQTPAPKPTLTHDGSSAPTSGPAPTPTLSPQGTAEENLAYFDYVNERLIAQNPSPNGRAFIDNLVAAGFDKSAMEVTPDTTAVNLQAANIVFSVRMGDGCLIGQDGDTGYQSTVMPVLATGKCLVGKTRPIDW